MKQNIYPNKKSYICEFKSPLKTLLLLNLLILANLLYGAEPLELKYMRKMPGNQWKPKISNGIIAFQDDRNYGNFSDQDIFLLDQNGEKPFQQKACLIDFREDMLLWKKNPGDGNYYLTNFKDGSTKAIVDPNFPGYGNCGDADATLKCTAKYIVREIDPSIAKFSIYVIEEDKWYEVELGSVVDERNIMLGQFSISGDKLYIGVRNDNADKYAIIGCNLNDRTTFVYKILPDSVSLGYLDPYFAGDNICWTETNMKAWDWKSGRSESYQYRNGSDISFIWPVYYENLKRALKINFGGQFAGCSESIGVFKVDWSSFAFSEDIIPMEPLLSQGSEGGLSIGSNNLILFSTSKHTPNNVEIDGNTIVWSGGYLDWEGGYSDGLDLFIIGDAGASANSIDTLDVSLDSLSVIQVIEKAPLIKNKATMVRVFVTLTGVAQADNISITLHFGGSVFTWKGKLINDRGLTYAFPSESSPDLIGNFLRNKRLNFTQDQLISENGINTVNFDFPGMLRPTVEGTILIKSDIFERSFDINPNNNSIQNNYNVKVPDGKEIIKFYVFTGFKNGYEIMNLYDEAELLVQESMQYLTAVYPIAENDISADDYIGLAYLPVEMLDNMATDFVFFIDYFFLFGQRFFTKILHPLYWRSVIIVDDLLQSGLTLNPYVCYIDSKDGGNFTVAHEIGHTIFGPGHYNILSNGWDVNRVTKKSQFTNLPYSMPAKLSSGTFITDNLMAAGAGDWISDWEYYGLMEKLINGGSDPHMLNISGIIINQQVTFHHFFDYYGSNDSIWDKGDYSIELYSKDNILLSSKKFSTFTKDSNIYFFSIQVPYPNGTEKVVMKYKGTTLIERTRTPNNPKLIINSVEKISEGKYKLYWSASDNDGDSLSYIFVFENGNYVLLPVFPDTLGKDFAIFDVGLFGGGETKIDMIVSDGMNTDSASSDVFHLPYKPPLVKISSPKDSASVYKSDSIIFRSCFYDFQGKKLNLDSMKWESDISGFLGNGKLIKISNLPVGKHKITFTLSDSLDQSASDTITIFVKDTLTDIEDNLCKRIEPNIQLSRCYPNPFDNSTTIEYIVPEHCSVILKIYNVLGQEIAELVNQYHLKGNYKIVFKPKNSETGFYYYRLFENDRIETGGLMYVK